MIKIKKREYIIPSQNNVHILFTHSTGSNDMIKFQELYIPTHVKYEIRAPMIIPNNFSMVLYSLLIQDYHGYYPQSFLQFYSFTKPSQS